jgi:signal transduction histidine kinase
LKSDLEGHNLEAEAQVAHDLAKFLREVIVQTRNLARGLVPIHMDEAGLISALDELTATARQLFGIQCVYETVGTPSIEDKTVATHLYRIAQEAINNATKHGNAKNVVVSLVRDANGTTLRIRDDGTGISKTAAESDGMGLSLMRYRARLVGGELRIEQSPSGGTVISCGIPLQLEGLRRNAA